MLIFAVFNLSEYRKSKTQWHFPLSQHNKANDYIWSHKLIIVKIAIIIIIVHAMTIMRILHVLLMHYLSFVACFVTITRFNNVFSKCENIMKLMDLY